MLVTSQQKNKAAFEHKLIKIIDNKLPMAIDMVYDIFRKHNPMLACVAEGHGILECSSVYRGFDFGNADGDRIYAGLPASRQLCYIGHAAGKDVLYNRQKTIPIQHKAWKKPKPFKGPVFIPNFSRNGVSHLKIIERQTYSSLFR
jgi:hypothetical protein